MMKQKPTKKPKAKRGPRPSDPSQLAKWIVERSVEAEGSDEEE